MELKTMELEEASLENVKQSETTQEVSNWEDTCRLCATMRDHMIPIFENEGVEHDLSNKIHTYLPIEVSKTDSLPHKLCYDCASTLLAWHELLTGCLSAEKRLLQQQVEIARKESSHVKQQEISNSDEFIEEIIIASEGSYQSIATEKLGKPSLSISNYGIEGPEEIQLKYVKSNSNELAESGITASSELVDDPESVEIEELETSGVVQQEKQMKLIHEQEESCATQQLEQISENVEERNLSQETAERSGRMKNAFKLLIDTQSISRKGIKIEVPDNISVAKGDEDSTRKNSLSPINEDRLSKLVSPCSEDDGTNTAKTETNHRISPRSERVKGKSSLEYKRVFTEKSESSQDNESMISDVSKSNDNCTSMRVKCTVCLREFSDIKSLQIHAKDHKDLPETRKIYQCIECDKSFRLKDSFVRHLRIHRDERPFTCHICGKQFRDSGGLSRHLKDVHAKLKNFSCDMCGKSFSSKATRDDHRRTHTGERPYVCETCNKSFKSKACLYSHSKLHSNEFPHPCAYCNRKFRRRQEMLVHATTHTGEKNYSCDVCLMRFRVKTEVARHKLTHSEEKPFVCSICGLRFRQNRYLNNHIKSRHVQSWKD